MYTSTLSLTLIQNCRKKSVSKTPLFLKAHFTLLNEEITLNILVLTSISTASRLELELYFYLNTVNLSDKIIVLKITIYFNLYKHGLKI